MADHLGGTQAPLGFPRVPHRLPLAPPDFPRLLSAFQASPGFPRLLKASLGFSRLPRLPQASQASPGFPRLPKASQGFPRLPKAPQASPGFPRLPQVSPSFPRLPLVPSGSSWFLLGTPGFPGSSWLLRAPLLPRALALVSRTSPLSTMHSQVLLGAPHRAQVLHAVVLWVLQASLDPWLPQASPGSLRPPLAPSGLPWLPQASPGSQASQGLPGLPQPNSPPGFPKCPGLRGGCESPGHARGSRGLTTAARGKSPGAADRILEFSTGSPKAAFALALGLLGFLGFQPYSSLARVWGQRGASLWPV